ncbi:hypothetical protein ACFE04_028421 [Oxalis oulophora]
MDSPILPTAMPEVELLDDEMVDKLFACVQSLLDAPILLLVYFHKALRKEMSELSRIAVAATERYEKDLILKLSKRLQFLKLVYKYHSAVEDEIVFLALDGHVEHVASTYSLEHKSIDDNFSSVFYCLDVLMEENNDNISKSLHELVFSIGIISRAIHQHMCKEEEQVFPLLTKSLCVEEQASLVWEFMCSIPLMLLEKMLPWMMSFLSLEERDDATKCIKEIAPKETLLQEVVISWLENNNEASFVEQAIVQEIHGPCTFANMQSAFRIHSSKVSDNWPLTNATYVQKNAGQCPVDGLPFWHSALTKDLREILDQLHLMRSSYNFQELDSFSIKLQFLTDVLIFYSTALENYFYPILDEFSDGCLPLDKDKFLLGSSIGGMQQLLHHNYQNYTTENKFAEMLCRELESFLVDVSKHFSFQETEVFPVVSKNCSHEMQQKLLYMSLHIMPLGLLKCVITWFSVHLSDDESRFILQSLNQEDSFVNRSFVSLIYEWFRLGYSGKTSVENFGKELQKTFKSRRSFISEESKEVSGCSSSLSDNKKHFEGSNMTPPGLLSTKEGKYCMTYYSSETSSSKYSTFYSSGISLQVFFPGTINTPPSFPKLPVEPGPANFFIDSPKPIDLVFYFHKALKNDMELLVSGSAKLTENIMYLEDFRKQFHCIWLRFQIHSDAEDGIALPALEAKGKLQDIGWSYKIDHRHEDENFHKISALLNEISELRNSFSMLRHRQLCMKLHGMCQSMHNFLCDHVHREEIELWPLFRKYFSVEEQLKIIQSILGRTSSEILKDIIPWQMEFLTTQEQQAMMSVMCNATKYTMFSEWLEDWWTGYNIAKLEESSSPPLAANTQEVISTFCDKIIILPKRQCVGVNAEMLENCILNDKAKVTIDDQMKGEYSESAKCSGDDEGFQKIFSEVVGGRDQNSTLVQPLMNEKYETKDSRLSTNQGEMKDATSCWIAELQITHQEATVSENGEEIPSQHPSYRDPDNQIFGCKHYKRNCKLFAPCCNRLYTCIRCHDELDTSHQIDGKTITKMMCMKCLKIQPLGTICSTVSCNNFSMAKYYCRICKLFDDEREIYHCPEKSFMDVCPICHEDIFTSFFPVKALPCGHNMHSACFEIYTCTSYICPLCSKSLGDMQLYFQMLDTLLAEEKMPEDYSGRTQKRESVPFHWLHHKCPLCKSYNTRLV